MTLPVPNPTKSHWLRDVQFGSTRSFPKDGEDASMVDVAIIGAGFSGCAIAYHLRRLQPDLKIAVLEARDVGGGATGRNGGLLWPGLSDTFSNLVNLFGLEATLTLLKFDHSNVDAIKQFVHSYVSNGNTPDPLLASFKSGSITNFLTTDEKTKAKSDLEALKKVGVSDSESGLEIWESDHVVKLTGCNDSLSKLGALVSKHGHRVVPAKLALALLKMATGFAKPNLPGRNADFYSEAPVVQIVRGSEGLKKKFTLITPRANIYASKVVHATNAWTRHLLPQVPVTPIKNQVIVTEPLANGHPGAKQWASGNWCMSANHGYEYMSGRGDGRIVLGGMRYLAPNMDVGNADDASLNPKVSNGLRNYLQQNFDDLSKNLSIDMEWAGIMGWSMDGLPYVGELDEIKLKDEFVMAGFSGHGMPRIFLSGLVIAQMVSGVDKDKVLEGFPKLFLPTEGRLKKSPPTENLPAPSLTIIILFAVVLRSYVSRHQIPRSQKPTDRFLICQQMTGADVTMAPMPAPTRKVLNPREKPITVITRDNIRTLRPHAADGSTSRRPVVLMPMSELERVKANSIYLSKEELLRRNQEFSAAKLEAAEAARQRKEKMENYDHQRTQNSKLSDLEKEAKDKSNYLLAKAQMQLEEQEDDIKHMNELMLYAKCVAIRDLQVEEKKVIHKERKDEDARLDAMMETERVNELKKLEEKEKRRVEELRKGAAKIRLQIEERREAALLESERRDQETKQILKQIAEMNEQDKIEKANKIQSQRLLMLEVAKANQESTERKRLQKESEEDEDRKVLQYLLEKEKRDIENDRIQQQKRAERELELARLRAAQEKISDKQAQQDALRAKRAYEAYERDWRRKEKENAEKQALMERELKMERIKQQRAREHTIAVEAHKMKEEFYENLARQKEIEERLKAEELKRAEKNKLYAIEVKAQINEKEQARRKAREEFFMEGIKQAQERIEKKNKIDQIKDRKIQ
ncbi:hypothetical protein HDU76_001072, partial [Blyttiomyces sp. JEL0837]